MQNTQNIDRKKLLVVFIPGIFIISIFLFFIFRNTKCEKLLSKNSGISQMAYSYYSEEHMKGNGTRAVSTGFYFDYEGEKYKVTTKRFAKPIAIGTPIIIRFIPESPDCNEILWDSVFIYENIKYEYLYEGEKGYECKSTKIEK
ncbi:hypothetical protein SAMN05216283_11764 [Sunxiuqinia elliptica]|uniref:Uncharacterized protein n=2 Tax=Sunxiuqinia elliptica TaxID=655355 RepID=A0A1I2M216_9BACT|nr:hypothetical protein SAMN05216283_11764 [Sunxiuqinia elliptica]